MLVFVLSLEFFTLYFDFVGKLNLMCFLFFVFLCC